MMANIGKASRSRLPVTASHPIRMAYLSASRSQAMCMVAVLWLPL